MQAEVFESNADADVCCVCGDQAVPRKKCHLPVLAAIIVEAFQNTAPRLPLAVVDFGQVEHGPQDDFAACAPSIFNNRPIPMFFAVFEAPGVS